MRCECGVTDCPQRGPRHRLEAFVMLLVAIDTYGDAEDGVSRAIDEVLYRRSPAL